MSGLRILVVDDEPQIIRFLKPALGAAGYDVVTAANAAEAIRLSATQSPDAVLLDLGLPDKDGKDVIREVRAFSQVPIIVLSARDRETEKISALDLGADDYVNKPFGIGELLARIRAVTRSRNQGKPVETMFRAGGLTIDTERHHVELAGQPVRLTPKEFDLLLLLVRNAGRVLTHKQILNTVWGPAHAEDVQYLRVLVGQLRQKIEPSPAEPTLVLTEPGIGYRLAD
ncbi:response regulator [Aestuariivirga sp.]|uniref:response regulator n=1 Tax=Aestuariivirga sp. TaxID=2650926 RepID=UPI0035B495B0